MSKLIYIMGIDGAGKTTLAKNFIQEMNKKGVKYGYLYARYRPFFIMPLKWLSSLLLYRKNKEFVNYKKYSEIKSKFGINHPFLSRAYAFLCILDYLIITGPLIFIKLLFNRNLIVDRYIGDLIIVLSVAANLKEQEMLWLIKILHLIFPFPKYTFYIDIDLKIAFKRKNDIPSLQYLKERKDKYFTFKDYYKFRILKGDMTPDELLQELVDSVTNFNLK